MSVSGEQNPQPAGEWNIVPVTVEEHQRFTDTLLGNYIGDRAHGEYHALHTLGILAASEAYFNQHEGIEEVTIIRNYATREWRYASKQFVVCVGEIGAQVRTHPLEEAQQNGEIAVIHSQLPEPAEMVALTGLEELRRRLEEDARERMFPTLGVNYVWLTRQNIGRILSIGYARPYTGKRLESKFPMGTLKSRYGYPPPPPFPSSSKTGYAGI